MAPLGPCPFASCRADWIARSTSASSLTQTTCPERCEYDTGRGSALASPSTQGKRHPRRKASSCSAPGIRCSASCLVNSGRESAWRESSSNAVPTTCPEPFRMMPRRPLWRVGFDRISQALSPLRTRDTHGSSMTIALSKTRIGFPSTATQTMSSRLAALSPRLVVHNRATGYAPTRGALDLSSALRALAHQRFDTFEKSSLRSIGTDRQV